MLCTSISGHLPHNKAADAGMPAGGEAEKQADLLGNPADAQLITGQPATAGPSNGPLEPPSGEQLSQPEAAQAAVASLGSADIEAGSYSGHSAGSEALTSGDPEGSRDKRQGLQAPATGMQHAGSADWDANGRALLDAVDLGKLKDVERLLEAGCSVDMKDAFDCTPLYIAAASEQLACETSSATQQSSVHFCSSSAFNPGMTCLLHHIWQTA